ncbi:hypothetical protein PanWU01x14_368470, partial [Parasponia andersonii]
SPFEELLKMNPTPLVLPRFNVGQNCRGPAKILHPTRFSGHHSVVRPPFLTSLANGVLSRRCR